MAGARVCDSVFPGVTKGLVEAGTAVVGQADCEFGAGLAECAGVGGEGEAAGGDGTVGDVAAFVSVGPEFTHDVLFPWSLFLGMIWVDVLKDVLLSNDVKVKGEGESLLREGEGEPCSSKDDE